MTQSVGYKSSPGYSSRCNHCYGYQSNQQSLMIKSSYFKKVDYFHRFH
jgi:hypothetical protein